MAEFPDLHHHMSKKIAQLTRVIFTLNTSKEEAEIYHKAQADAYEKEIDRIVREANSIISKQKELLERHKSIGDPAALISSIQIQYEEAKSRAVTDLAVFKKQTEDRENKICKEAQGTNNRYKNEVGELRDALRKQMAQFEGKQLTSASALDELRRNHQRELDAYIKEQNGKYTQLLQDKLDSEDKLKEDMQKALKKLTEEMDAKIKQAVAKTRDEEKTKAQKLLDDTSAGFLKKLDELGNALKSSEEQKRQVEKTASELQGEIKKVNSLLAEWERKYKKLADDYSTLENAKTMTGEQANKLGTELSSTQKELNNLQRIIRERDKTIENMTKEYEDMVNSFRKEIFALKSNTSEKENLLHTELENKKEKIEAMQHEINLLTQNLKEVKEELEISAEKLKRTTDQLEYVTEQNDSNIWNFKLEKDKFTQEMQTLKDTIQNLKDEIHNLNSNSSEQVKQLQSEILKKEQTHKEELQNLIIKYQEGLDKLKNEHTAEINKLTKDNEYFKQCLKEEFTTKLNTQKNEYEEKIKKLTDDLNKVAGQASQYSTSLQSKIQELENTVNTLQQEIKKLESVNDQKDKTIQQLNAQLSNLQDQLRDAEKQILTLRSSGENRVIELTNELQQLKKEMEMVVIEWKNKLEDERKAAVLRQEQALKDLKALHSQEFDNLQRKYQDRLNNVEKGNSDKLDLLADEIKKIAAEKDTLEQEWRKKYADFEMHQNQRIKDMEAILSARLSEKDGLVKDMERKFKETLDYELETLRNRLAAEKEAALKELEEIKRKQMELLAYSHESALQKMSRDFDTQLAQKSAEFERTIAELSAQLEKERKEKQTLSDNLQSTKNLLQEEKERSVAELKRWKDEVSKEIAARSAKEQEIQRLETLIKKEKQEWDSYLDQKIREFSRKEAEIRAQAKDERDSILKKNLMEMQELQQDFQNTTEMMEERYRELQIQFNDLQEMYDNRPSRHEDIALIKHLQDDVANKEEALRKAYEDMKFYKLELINREENYNKVFGANPSVGVLNPLVTNKKPKPGKTSAISNREQGMGSSFTRKPSRVG